MSRVRPKAAAMPSGHADERQPHAVPDDELANGGAVRAQSHADAHLLGALLDGVRHESVDADGGQN